MVPFMRRLITETLSFEVCNEGWLSGVSIFFDCPDDNSTFDELVETLKEGTMGPCAGLAPAQPPGQCRPLAEDCPEFPNATPPPCMTPEGCTVKTPIHAGDLVIEVTDESVLSMGDVIQIGNEKDEVIGFNPLRLSHPLEQDHAVGESVEIFRKASQAPMKKKPGAETTPMKKKPGAETTPTKKIKPDEAEKKVKDASPFAEAPKKTPPAEACVDTSGYANGYDGCVSDGDQEPE
jgi:hypothetical protein